MRFRIFLLLLMLPFLGHGQDHEKIVMTMDIKSEIDPLMTRYVKLALDHAQAINADIVLIEMDTYGGALTDAKDIVDLITGFQAPVWVFIHNDAASAGALISIACDSIYMSPGATIGAATVVDASGQKAPDKYQSYMRSIMRSTAEENGRDPKIAEGMVDEDLVIPGIKKEGKVITFTTSEALEHGFCEAKVNSIKDIFDHYHIEDYQIEHFEPSAADRVISFFLNPIISGILILIIIGGIWYELQTPGIGFPLIAAIVALVLYLVPYYLNGLAANWEIITLIVGFILIVLEIFVIPGFGITGITGIILTVGSLILVMVNNDVFNFSFVPADNMLLAVTATLGGLLGGVIVIFIGGARLSKSHLFKKVALTSSEDRSHGFTSTFHSQPMVGKGGTAYTVLRPAGKVMIEGKLYDAFTRGDYIDKGQRIEVVAEDTTSLQVKASAV